MLCFAVAPHINARQCLFFLILIMGSCGRADDGTGAQRWMLTAATNNYMVYEIQNVARAACANYLSCPGCGNGAFADLYNIDDNSGRQQWRFAHT